MTIYDRIRELRLSLGMSQRDLAHKVGYKDGSMITKIESGQVDISQKKIVAFSNALSTTPGYLMGWTDDPSPLASEHRLLFSPNSEIFRKILVNMDPIDYQIFMDILEKTEIRLRQEGKL